MTKDDCFGKVLEAATQMAECIYNLDEPKDLPENSELVEFLCVKPVKPALKVQDPLETIDLGTGEDPIPIQISGLLKAEYRTWIVNLLHEFKDCFAWHYTEMPDKEDFEWGKQHQEAFDNIRAYLASPPMLMPPQRGKPLKLYISASERSIGSLLAQNNEDRKEQVVYYLSIILTEMAIKGQTITDFLAEHQESQGETINISGTLEVAHILIPPSKAISGREKYIQQEVGRISSHWVTPSKLYFDGSCTQNAAGAGIVIIAPRGIHHCYSFFLDYQETTNNRVEYKVLIIGLEILIELGAMKVEVFGDSELVEAAAVKNITSATVKKFIETKILHRFGVPEVIVTDRGPSFISKEVEEFANKFRIKMVRSSPYYPKSKGQANASNKILVSIIKRTVAENPEKWHERLGETLWAYRTSKRTATGTTPYALTFGQDVVIPMKIKIEDLDVAIIEALNKIQEGNVALARAYNKKVLCKGGYYLADMDRVLQKHPINVKFLKIYHLTLWDARDYYIEEE
ncbi:unnamed protein product [Malus baccata var. baccata]